MGSQHGRNQLPRFFKNISILFIIIKTKTTKSYYWCTKFNWITSPRFIRLYYIFTKKTLTTLHPCELLSRIVSRLNVIRMSCTPLYISRSCTVKRSISTISKVLFLLATSLLTWAQTSTRYGYTDQLVEETRLFACHHTFHHLRSEFGQCF